jgi:hypothetical protein
MSARRSSTRPRALLKGQMLAGRADRPLRSALERSQLLPGHRHRDAQPGSRAGGKWRRRGGPVLIAQVVYEDPLIEACPTSRRRSHLSAGPGSGASTASQTRPFGRREGLLERLFLRRLVGFGQCEIRIGPERPLEQPPGPGEGREAYVVPGLEGHRMGGEPEALAPKRSKLPPPSMMKTLGRCTARAWSSMAFTVADLPEPVGPRISMWAFFLRSSRFRGDRRSQGCGSR